MGERHSERLSDAELYALFDALFPHGFGVRTWWPSSRRRGGSVRRWSRAFTRRSSVSSRSGCTYLTRNSRDAWRGGDYLRFYMGTFAIAGRADLEPVYELIFRRLKALGADWIYHFPELMLVDLTPLHSDADSAPTSYSVSDEAVAELKAQRRRAELERLRAELADANARARADAMDRPPPATVRAYRDVYGRDPRGWPPA